MIFDHWLIQSSGLHRRQEDELRMVNSLKAADIGFTDFGIIPFTSQITGWEQFPNRPVFMHGSTKMLKVLINPAISAADIFVGASAEEAALLRNRLLAGIFYDIKAFDQSHYARLLRPHNILLNDDAVIAKIKDVRHMVFNEPMFAKPVQDLKLFKGGIIEAGQSIHSHVMSGMIDDSFVDATEDLVIISAVKKIDVEYRFFVVDGEVITGSQYMINGQVKYDSYITPAARATASAFARLYQPAQAFTLDIGQLSTGEYKIVEYNAINCSGLYHADIGKLAHRLSTRFYGRSAI